MNKKYKPIIKDIKHNRGRLKGVESNIKEGVESKVDAVHQRQILIDIAHDLMEVGDAIIQTHGGGTGRD